MFSKKTKSFLTVPALEDRFDRGTFYLRSADQCLEGKKFALALARYDYAIDIFSRLMVELAGSNSLFAKKVMSALAESYIAKSDYYAQQGLLRFTLEQCYLAREQLEKLTIAYNDLSDYETLAELYLTMANLHAEFGEKELAFNHRQLVAATYRLLAQLHEAEARKEGEYTDKGSYHIHLAIHTLEKINKEAKQPSDCHVISKLYFSLGVAHLKANNTKKSVEYYQLGLAAAKRVDKAHITPNDHRLHAYYSTCIGDLYNDLADSVKASRFFKLAAINLLRIEESERTVDDLKILVKMFKRTATYYAVVVRDEKERDKYLQKADKYENELKKLELASKYEVLPQYFLSARNAYKPKQSQTATADDNPHTLVPNKRK